MRVTFAAVALVVLAACAPKAEEAPAVDSAAMAPAAPAADTTVVVDSAAAAATDTTKPM